uniref:CXADR Ig-like cell adhesion molecule n=1 Tax=Takifugu rubripes TaxID=31033 RepID=A0A674NS70_TAKRU
FCVCLCVFPGLASGLEITTTGPSSIEKASGQSVKLECQFHLAAEDTGPLDIEWSLMASTISKRTKWYVILYSGDRAYEDYYEPMRGRVHFNSADPKNGDASINLTGLKSSDSGTYQCKVKKAPGIRSRKMLLIVMVKPSKPRCHADGPTEEGKDVVLKCMSSDGTQPLKYTWEKTSDNKLLPASAVMGKYAQDLQNKRSTSLKVPYYRVENDKRMTKELERPGRGKNGSHLP